MKESWDKGLAFTLEEEGGYSSGGNDPGGETNYGISKRYHPDVDIKNLTVDQASGIYHTEYWDAMKCDDLPYPLDIVVFDSSVNPGTGATGRFLAISQDWRDLIFF